MNKLIYILPLLLIGCGTIQQGIDNKLWPPPEANTEGNFTLQKLAEGDYVLITKARVQKADIAFFRYTCLYPDVAKNYERVGFDNEPVPMATDTMRVDCRSVLRVEMEIVNNHASKHAKNTFVIWQVPIAEWLKKHDQ